MQQHSKSRFTINKSINNYNHKTINNKIACPFSISFQAFIRSSTILYRLTKKCSSQTIWSRYIPRWTQLCKIFMIDDRKTGLMASGLCIFITELFLLGNLIMEKLMDLGIMCLKMGPIFMVKWGPIKRNALMASIILTTYGIKEVSKLIHFKGKAKKRVSFILLKESIIIVKKYKEL